MGRAATRLQMTQPPLSRAVQQLEGELGATLLIRRPQGVELTGAGVVLYREARSMLDQADRLTARISAAAGAPTITVGTCADTADQLGSRLVTAFRHRHPDVGLTLWETDLTDPTAGLRTDMVDVALTRAPFDDTTILTHVVRTEPIGVVVLDSDPLAQTTSVSVAELHGRRWVRLPEGTDTVWSAYWQAPDPTSSRGEPVVVRTIQESLQSVLWSGTTTFAPRDQPLPEGLVTVPVSDKDPSHLVVAWRRTEDDPLVRSFVEVATATSGAA